MAVTRIEPVPPVMAQPGDVDPAAVVFSYDRDSDTLMVKLFDRARSAYSDPIGDDLYLRRDPNTNEVVGFQIEHFLLYVVREHPAFLDVAEVAGVPSEEVAAIRRSIASEVRHQAAVDTVLSHVAELSYPPDEADQNAT